MDKLPVFNSEPDDLAKSVNELYGNKLTSKQTAEAKGNLLQFFELLVDIDRSAKCSE